MGQQCSILRQEQRLHSILARLRSLAMPPADTATEVDTLLRTNFVSMVHLCQVSLSLNPLKLVVSGARSLCLLVSLSLFLFVGVSLCQASLSLSVALSLSLCWCLSLSLLCVSVSRLFLSV